MERSGLGWLFLGQGRPNVGSSNSLDGKSEVCDLWSGCELWAYKSKEPVMVKKDGLIA